MATKKTMTNALVTAMANAVKDDTDSDLEGTARSAATATGLRRAVWAVLSEEEQGRLIRAAIRRARATTND